RLKSENLGGAWCPKNQITQEAREWLEIDLHTIHLITATATQGRFGNGVGVEFTEAYLLEYWRPRLGKWVRYRDIKGKEVLMYHNHSLFIAIAMVLVRAVVLYFSSRMHVMCPTQRKILCETVIQGNTNTYLESKHELEPPLWASKIRFLPYSYHRRTVCMRVELYGCYWSDGVVSYSMPQGDKRSNGWEFFDMTYDGHWDGELRRGLGQLTDGRTGPDNFKMYYDNDRAQGWVGWRNDSRGQPVEIKFEFDKVREFSAVHIYCNNEFTRGVQVFSQIDILFSIGGKYYTGEPITYTYMEDKIFETSRNVTIKLHHRVGKFVKLRLHFSDRWIMVSEVTFDSDRTNATIVVFRKKVNQRVGPLRGKNGKTKKIIKNGEKREQELRRESLDQTVVNSVQPRTGRDLNRLKSGYIAHGNFTLEEAPTTESPIQSDVFVEKNGAAEGELPVSTAKHDDPTYMAIVIGVLTAVILSLAVAIFLIVSRHRQRKCFASPMTGKAPSHLGSTCATVEKGAALMAYTLEDDESFSTVPTDSSISRKYYHLRRIQATDLEDFERRQQLTWRWSLMRNGSFRVLYATAAALFVTTLSPGELTLAHVARGHHALVAQTRDVLPVSMHNPLHWLSHTVSLASQKSIYAGGSLPTLPLGNRLLDIVKLDDYQEPYQALKYAPYYSYSTVVMEMKDMMLNNKGTNINHSAVYANGAVDTSYDYAVPELGTVPLLNQDAGTGRAATVSNATGDQDNFFSKSSRKTEDKKSPTQQEVLSALKRRLEQTSVPLFPRHRLRMLSKLAEGAFGTVYVAEAEGIPEYGTTTTLGKRLVAVKFLLPKASEKEK
ncbi:Discoidin domain-containing receptor 2, partial [Cyphomyrmex costatus]